MIRYLVVLLLIPTSVLAEELLLTSDLFRSNSYGALKLSPNGDFIVGLKQEPRRTLLYARESGKDKETTILTLDNEQNDKITQITWVNSNTLFINYFTPYQKLRLIEIYKSDSGIQNRGFDIKANGFLIDPVVEDKNRLIFAHYQHEDDDFNAIDTNIDSLKSGKLKSAKILNKSLDNSKFFATDSQHNLRLVSVLDDDKIKLMFYSETEKRWVSIMQKLSRRDTFKPLVILGDSIYALSNYGRDKVGVIKFTIGEEDNIEVLYESEEYDLTSAKIDRKTGELITVTYLEYGKAKAEYFDTDIPMSLQSRDEFKNKQLIRINQSFNGNHALYSVSSPTFPGAYYYHNQSENLLIHLYDMLPHLNAIEFPQTITELVSISNSEKIEAYLTLPNSTEQKYPMLVVPHGGPIGIRDSNSFNRRIQMLANRGYAVLRVNFRGSRGFGKKFQLSGVAQFGKQIEEDIEKAVRHVLKKYSIDSNRMCIMGSSYGGYSALMSTIKYPKRYKCAVSSFGVTDLPLLFSSNNRFRDPKIRERLTNVVGDVYKDLEHSQMHSPVYRADELNTPILILAGAKDKTAYPEHSIRLDYVLTKLGKEPEFEMYRDSGHGHPTVAGIRHEMLRTLEFIDKYLQLNTNYNAKDKLTLAHEALFLSTQYRTSGVADKSIPRMVEFAERASALGSVEGKFLMATYYSNGISLKRDIKKAVRYYKEASDLAHKGATMHLAESYKYGRNGLSKNRTLALKYYTRAFEQNSFEGGYQMALLMICEGQKEAAIEALKSMENKAANYSEYAINEIKRTNPHALNCH